MSLFAELFGSRYALYDLEKCHLAGLARKVGRGSKTELETEGEGEDYLDMAEVIRRTTAQFCEL